MLNFCDLPPPPPENPRADLVAVIYLLSSICPSHSLRVPMNTQSLALLNHVNELRRLVTEAPSASEQYESAVLLIDVYERMLMDAGVLSFSEEEEIRH
jgi:hypothetical protein